MALPDDPTKVPLPQMKVPGMGNPPAATPAPTAPAGTGTPFADLRGTMQQVANVTSAPAPKPAPLHSPDTGATILPVLRSVDGAMRDAGGAISSGAQAVGAAMSAPLAPSTGSMSSNPDWAKNLNGVNPIADAASAAGRAMVDGVPTSASGYTSPNPTDPSTNGRTAAPGSTLNFDPISAINRNAAAVDAADAGVKALYPKGTYETTPVVPAAGAPAPRNWQDDYRVKAPEGAAPAAPETPMLSGTGAARMIEMDNGQKLFTNVNSGADAINGLKASNGVTYGMPAPGGAPAGNPNLGTAEDNMRQIQNMRALSDMTPQGGFNTLTDHAAEINAANEKRSNLAAAIEGMNKAGTRSARAGFAQLVNTLQAGENQVTTTGMNNQVQLAGQASQAGTAAAGHQVQMRGQDKTTALGMKQVGEQARGHDLQHEAATGQTNAVLQGQKVTAANAAANIEANKAIHEADNAARLEYVDRQVAGSAQTKRIGAPALPGQWMPKFGGGYERIVVDKATGKTTVETAK